MAAVVQRWWRGPPEQTQRETTQPGQTSPVKFMTLLPCFPTLRPLIAASRSTEWTRFVTSIQLSFLSLPCSTFPSFFWISIYLPPFLYLVSRLPSIPRQPGQLLIQTVSTVIQEMLSRISKATCRCFSRQRQICLFSVQHPSSKCDLKTPWQDRLNTILQMRLNITLRGLHWQES